MSITITKAGEFSNFNNDLSFWPTISITNIPISKKFNKLKAGVVFMPLLTNKLSDPTPLIFGVDLSYQLNDKLAIGGGYDNWLLNIQDVKKRDNRMHPYQQILIKHKLKDFTINGRIRLEEISSDEFNTFCVRNRNKIKVTYPLPQIGNFNSGQKYYAIISDEVHFNLSEKKPNYELGFEENFFFIGVGKSINKFVNIEGGYYLLATKTTKTKPDLLNHCIGINIFLKVP